MGNFPKKAGSILTTRQIIEAFASKLYGEKKVREAYEKWVTEDYIQHNPEVADGRESAISFLENLMINHPVSTFEVKRIFVDEDYAILHLHAKLIHEDAGLAIIDIFRISGGAITEHWDAIQKIPETQANSNGIF